MQTFEKVNREFQIPKTSRAIRGIMAHSILTGDRKRAAEILRIAGGNILISGTSYTTRKAIANFYDVADGYISGIFRKYGITYKDCPECVIRSGIYSFEHDHGMCYSRVLKLESGKSLECGACGTMSFYDARAVLAFACLAFLHRKIVPGSNTQRMLDILKRSDYYTEAQEIEKKSKAAEEKPEESIAIPGMMQPTEIQTIEVPEASEASDFSFKLNENGEVVIPLDILAEIIKKFIVKVSQQ